MMEYIKAYNDNELFFEGTVQEFLFDQKDEGFLEYVIESRSDDVIRFDNMINGNWKFVIT